MQLTKIDEMAFQKLIEFEAIIFGKTEQLSVEVAWPDDFIGLGLGWSHYVLKSQIDNGFKLISTINADADYALVIAFSDKDCDFSPPKTIVTTPSNWSQKSKKKIGRLLGNLELRLEQIGIEKTGNHEPEILNHLVEGNPFRLHWCEVAIKWNYGNGVTVIAGIDPSGKNVFANIHSESEVELSPLAVRYPNLRKAPMHTSSTNETKSLLSHHIGSLLNILQPRCNESNDAD